MRFTFPEYADYVTADHSQDDLFLFHSNVNLVRAKGVNQRLTTPITSSSFSQEVDALFKREKKRGVTNPILVGAIPFDLNRPAQLMAPLWHERVPSLARTVPSFMDRDFIHQAREHRFTPDHVTFLNMIEQALQQFELSPLKKIVLSKILTLTLDKPVDVSRLLANIMAQNPSAYHFNVPLDGGFLIGASPELLIRKEGERVFSNPLAGSARRSSNAKEDQAAAIALLSSVKDQYEHRLVVDALRAALSPLVDELQVPMEPSVISTPTMWHLSTDIEAKLPAINPPTLFELIEKIHPTPAMCGTPTALAQHQISSLEPHQRGFFSGLVGWCDSQGNGEWAIAIRCASVSENTVTLFAGAGVVPDSTPESEWLETSAKMRTMLNALGIKEEEL